jgi:hypothetical protein
MRAACVQNGIRVIAVAADAPAVSAPLPSSRGSSAPWLESQYQRLCVVGPLLLGAVNRCASGAAHAASRHLTTPDEARRRSFSMR